MVRKAIALSKSVVDSFASLNSTTASVQVNSWALLFRERRNVVYLGKEFVDPRTMCFDWFVLLKTAAPSLFATFSGCDRERHLVIDRQPTVPSVAQYYCRWTTISCQYLELYSGVDCTRYDFWSTTPGTTTIAHYHYPNQSFSMIIFVNILLDCCRQLRSTSYCQLFPR